MYVSIIIPAYNAAETIAETLESIWLRPTRIGRRIVIDDGSTDATPKIAKDFADRDLRFRVITQPNAGEAGARNAGIAQARYDWLLFLDADDWISPRHLERMTTELRSNPIWMPSTAVTPALPPTERKSWRNIKHRQAICFQRWHGASLLRFTRASCVSRLSKTSASSILRFEPAPIGISGSE